jgi:hypothetical protein
MPATIQELKEVEQQVRDLCIASGLSEQECTNAEIKATGSHITVSLVSNTYGWVLRFQYAKKGQRLPHPILTHIWLTEDSGELVSVDLVDGASGKELPWGYT